MIDPVIRKHIEPTLPLELSCDKHPKERISGFSMEDRKLTCPKCPKVSDRQRYMALDYGTVDACTRKMLGFMVQRKEELTECIDTFNRFLE